jgi:hypothetical protein
LEPRKLSLREKTQLISTHIDCVKNATAKALFARFYTTLLEPAAHKKRSETSVTG